MHLQPFFRANLSSKCKIQWFFDVWLGRWPYRKREKFSWWKEPGLAKSPMLLYSPCFIPKAWPTFVSNTMKKQITYLSNKYPIQWLFIDIDFLTYSQQILGKGTMPGQFLFLLSKVFHTPVWLVGWVWTIIETLCSHTNAMCVYTHPFLCSLLENPQM